MPRVLLIIAVVMLTVYCVVEVAQSRGYRVRSMPRWLWAFAVICVPVNGSDHLVPRPDELAALITLVLRTTAP